jgi:aromatic-L-amino-acid/L-tryptophan decarboxylase
MDVNEFRSAGHKVVDRLAEYFESIESKAVFPSADPKMIAGLFDEPLPEGPEAMDDVLAEIEEKLLPYCTHVGHPGYMGLITPSPNPVGVIGDFICSALNQNLGVYSIGPSAVAMERRVVRWLTDMVGFAAQAGGAKAGGNLTSGGMMANFIGLKLARDWASKDRAQHQGVHERWAAYVSDQRHVSVDKAVDAIGLGREALRALPTDAEFRLRIDALEAAIEKDKKDGVRPMCVVGIFRHDEYGCCG